MQEQVERSSQGPKSQFQTGHQIPIEHHKKPGLQEDLENPKPTSTQLPTEDNGYQTYKAAGKLSGKRAIITGGDSGIGRAVAILYAMEGASSLITYLPEEEKDAQETKRRVEEIGQACYCLATDLRDKANCKKVVDTALQSLDGIDILVNNAGTQTMIEDIKDLDEEQWESTFDTNIHSIFYLSKYAMPHLKNGSAIINCASVNPYIGRPDLLDYTSTKGAIVAFTRGLSNQQVKNGIRVNCDLLDFNNPYYIPIRDVSPLTSRVAKQVLHGGLPITFYLWQRDGVKTPGAVTQTAPRGANQEYIKGAEGNENGQQNPDPRSITPDEVGRSLNDLL
ncbi:hypothetical protein N7475_005048 [Penicillium sp. IBT 31633x]|nr:hypothetical protein N7475_005048 [Penicillium sp. IBT 31633x]